MNLRNEYERRNFQISDLVNASNTKLFWYSLINDKTIVDKQILVTVLNQAI